MNNKLHLLSSYQFPFDESLIAQHPATPRDSSRLMLIDRATGNISDHTFRDICDILQPNDSLIFNDTKVIPARLIGSRSGGGKTEVFLLQPMGDGSWKALVKPSKKLKPGSTVMFSSTFECEVLEQLPDGCRRVRFAHEGSFEDALEKYGQIPLPHYIKRAIHENIDKERYQTVYAHNPGAVAAPTAGLHFTEELLGKLKDNNVSQHYVTLHVGLGTFRPVQVEDVRHHTMHFERCSIPTDTATALNTRNPQNKQVCVGTTCCRLLESAARAEGNIQAGNFETDIFIYPGYSFKYVDTLLTNFHLPGSTLLMLVSALAGYELTMEAYRKAVTDKYRFFSYGDAMLIL